MQQQSNSFTVTFNGIARDLRCPCGFAAAFDPATVLPGQPEPYLNFTAVWDTGATGTVISQGIIDQCGLKPIGMTQAHGVDGIHDTELFLVNIRLPNGVGFANVTVTRGKLHGFDALIGMNIIAQGDFAVSNYKGITVFSFRMPSLACLDFVKDHGKVNTPWGTRTFEHGGGKKKKGR